MVSASHISEKALIDIKTAVAQSVGVSVFIVQAENIPLKKKEEKNPITKLFFFS